MSAVLSEERAVALMTNKQVLDLLRKIDDGYRPSKEEVERLSSIEKVTWNGIAIFSYVILSERKGVIPYKRVRFNNEMDY